MLEAKARLLLSELLSDIKKLQQEEANKRSVEMNANLTKFQETNTQLQKNFNWITAQNAESLKLLNETKEKARELERQLKEAKSNSGSNIGMIVAVIVAIIFFVMYLSKIANFV